MNNDDICKTIGISFAIVVLMLFFLGYIYWSVKKPENIPTIISRQQIDNFGQPNYFSPGPLMNSYNVDQKSLKKYAKDFIEPFKENISRFAPSTCYEINRYMKIKMQEIITECAGRGEKWETIDDCIIECMLKDNTIGTLVLIGRKTYIASYTTAIMDVFKRLYGDDKNKEEEYKIGIRRVLSAQIRDLKISENLNKKCVEEMLEHIARNYIVCINNALENSFVEIYEPDIKKMLTDNNNDSQYINLARRLIIEYTNEICRQNTKIFITALNGTS